MIPSAAQIAAAYRFVARRYGVDAEPDALALEKAVKEAVALVRRQRDEPAALFFALARRQRALPGLWTPVVGLLVSNHVRTIGLELNGDARDLLPLYVPIARGAMRFEEVLGWFEARLR